MSRFQKIKDAVAEARNEAYYGGKQSVGKGIILQSRGSSLIANDKGGSIWQEGEWAWDGTKKDLEAAIAKAKADPKAIELYISGGYDGAESPYDFREGNYCPWVSEWCVLLWARNPVLVYSKPESFPFYIGD